MYPLYIMRNESRLNDKRNLLWRTKKIYFAYSFDWLTLVFSFYEKPLADILLWSTHTNFYFIFFVFFLFFNNDLMMIVSNIPLIFKTESIVLTVAFLHDFSHMLSQNVNLEFTKQKAFSTQTLHSMGMLKCWNYMSIRFVYVIRKPPRKRKR